MEVSRAKKKQNHPGATQWQFDGFFRQLSYNCHQNRVAFVGYSLKISPWVASRVDCPMNDGREGGGRRFTGWWSAMLYGFCACSARVGLLDRSPLPALPTMRGRWGSSTLALHISCYPASSMPSHCPHPPTPAPYTPRPTTHTLWTINAGLWGVWG